MPEKVHPLRQLLPKKLQQLAHLAQTAEEPSSAACTSFDKVIKFLENDDWSYNTDRDNGIIQTNVGLPNGNYRVILQAKEEDDILIVYTFLPCKVPAGIKRQHVSEFITRANYGLTIGNFELDFGDGEVRYKGSVQFTEGVLSEMMIKHLIGISVTVMDRYFPGIMSVIYSDTSAVDAISLIEPTQAEGGAPVEAVAVQVVDATQCIQQEAPQDDSEDEPSEQTSN